MTGVPLSDDEMAWMLDAHRPDNGGDCYQCEKPWPCDAFRLLIHITYLQGQLAVAEQWIRSTPYPPDRNRIMVLEQERDAAIVELAEADNDAADLYQSLMRGTNESDALTRHEARLAKRQEQT